ncbi:MAG: Maf family protein [Myxococcaceae bacterium]|nr:Maf family protein [Myxococcaceae bacterium]MCI0672468.1 Maf family protein [Myxococcaceae bacterium]
MPELLLASTSSARRALMDALGLPYRAVSPDVDEGVPPGTPAREAVLLLAERKARAVAARYPEALVLGADQLVEVGGEVLGKPADREQARRQLMRVLGRVHDIVTGVALVGPGVHTTHVESTLLRFYPLQAEELERYLDLEEWRGCAGSYRIEGAGMGLIAGMEGDLTNVRGLPMLAVVRMLRQAGVTFFPSRR